MTDDFTRFVNEVDEAVTRARRAAAEAREQATKFRAATPDSAEPTAEALRAAAVTFRTAQGLPVDEPAEEPQTPPVPPPGDEDEDFSQEQIMTRFYPGTAKT